jgi:hypothetical protein
VRVLPVVTIQGPATALGFPHNDGRMRDVRVYKRVLTAAEVRQLYASGPSP